MSDAIGAGTDPGLLDVTFGAAVADTPFWTRMAASRRLFVRSADHVSEWRPKAEGRVLSATEFASTYDVDALLRIADGRSAGGGVGGVGPLLSSRMRILGIGHDDVAAWIGLDGDDVVTLLADRVRRPVRDLTVLAKALGLDPWLVGVATGPGSSCVDIEAVTAAHDGSSARLSAVLRAWEEAVTAKLLDWVGRACPDGVGERPLPAVSPGLEHTCVMACEVGVITADTAHDLVRPVGTVIT